MKLGNESNQIDEAFDINEVYVVQKYSENLMLVLKGKIMSQTTKVMREENRQ